MTPVEEYLAARQIREKKEAARIGAVKARGDVPAECGPMVPEAPARGTFRVFDPYQLFPDGEGYAVKSAGYRGRKAMQISDAFDTMEAQARKVLFTAEQKDIGRAYGALYEKLECAGVRCTSIEALSQQRGGGGGEYIDALLRDRERLDHWRRRIGGRVALEVRRVRPSDRNKRGLISDQRLVYLVCVAGLTLSQVLSSCGWVAPGQRAQGKHIKALRAALCDALDRMAGHFTKRRVVVDAKGKEAITRGQQYMAADWLHEQAEKHQKFAKSVEKMKGNEALAETEASLARSLRVAARHMKACADNPDG
ncbi:hypothetical protein K3722_07440 [Leisingera caerulea]|uniref:Uncharacterized protein n=1 Tax=Leisingera caerulea TaxID=506591 RepID=A0ABY5X117_LEICA|nr:hypothetical protein [Leisingera caerulea]UWQ59954.1 hypothetical protein K3722_07440 [Leisingera caerulea]